MTKNQIITMLNAEDFSCYYKQADEIRKQNVGNKILIRALLEFSNNCSRNCKYCGLNCFNAKLSRFRITKQEILECVEKACKVGYKTVVLQSGEDFSAKEIGEIVKEIKKSFTIAVTLSCGEFSYDEYKYLKECGADRYLLKHETSDERLYSYLHDGYSLKDRVNCLKNIKEIGYELGGGFMVGLPNQTMQTLAEDLLLLQQLQCDMAGIGPFIPHNDTVLKNCSSGSTELTKRCVAIARMLLPKANLPATTALGVLDINDKKSVFDCGANVIMQKITPNNVKRLYEIYPSHLNDITIEDGRKEVENQIIALNKIPY